MRRTFVQAPFSRLPTVWGATPDEVDRRYPCDEGMHGDRLVRAVSVGAEPGTVFAWLGNLRAAPYSYDWFDNFGRRSPRRLLTHLGDLAPGQRVMTIFEVDSVEPGRSVTISMTSRPGRALFGAVRVTYAVTPADRGCRLVAVLRFASSGTRLDATRRWVMAWGDLLMMRKQLLTLRDLSEGS
ncbi:hypothetical protein SGUI_0702 [Serinicoccus hydrothermalis]|uniref:Uncharacterized protein n=1 Tax=Serinicoccus hydrothermalis TaxID=1758689 RepID=A0A1B1N9K4_9MICO|nr:hypothetical protein SGUI_0702 [Serinicoccus hydrothermalis]